MERNGNYKPSKAECNATGLYLKEIGFSSLLTHKDEINLAYKIQKGDEIARHRFIEANLRLVVKTARRYHARGGVEFIDLVSEGNLGLIHAIEKLDPSLGFRFSTYAVWWIKQSIERAIYNQARVIRVPVHVLKELNSYYRAFKALTQKLKTEPTAEEVADFLDRPMEDVIKMLDLTKKQDSLDITFKGSDKSFVDMVEDKSKRNIVEDQEFYERISGLLDHLNPREKKVLCMRFGLLNEGEHTLDDIGLAIGRTRERVRQIQANALKKLIVIAKEHNIDPSILNVA